MLASAVSEAGWSYVATYAAVSDPPVDVLMLMRLFAAKVPVYEAEPIDLVATLKSFPVPERVVPLEVVTPYNAPAI